MSARILIAKTGTANTASVCAALTRAGATPVLTDDPDAIAGAERAILPGVGTFGAALKALRATGMDAAIAERVRSDRPLLTICVGLQVLFDTSEESPDVAGLGLVPGAVERFPKQPGLLVPQLGWNHVEPTAGARLLTPGHAYFANSYHATALPAGWDGALAHHGGPFIAAIERGAVLACQFHLELSGEWGAGLLSRWLDATSKRTPC